jgi:hypothetical protein
MSDYKGDFAEDAIITMTFNTFDSDGASVTITDLATTDVFVYKDGVVLAYPDAGVTLTLNAGTGDGAHIIKVDMSSDAQYVTGADYEAKFEGATIDGNTVNVWIGEWSCQHRFMRGTDSAALATTIGTPANIDSGGATIADNLKKLADDNGGLDFDATTDSQEAIRDRGDAAWTTGAGGSDRLLMVDTTIATLATQTSFTLTAGSEDDDAYNNLSIVVEDVSTATQKSVGMVLNYTGVSKTITLKEALAFTIATTDKVYILAENSLKSTVANRQLDVTATGGAGIDWANVENPTTALDLSQTDIQLVDTATALGADAVDSTSIADNAITAAKINADAITNAKIADDAIAVENIKDAAITAPKIAGDAITAAKIAANAIGATEIADGAIDAATFAANAITSTVIADNAITAAKLNADCITNAKIADDAIGAENFATDALSADALSAAAVDEIWAKAMSDLAAVPGATASVLAAINFSFMSIRNAQTATSSLQTISNDAGTPIAETILTDNGTTTTKGEYTNP